MIRYGLYKTLRFFHLLSKKKYTSGYFAIYRSKYFDKDWYLEQNSDVKELGIDPVMHYLNYGWRENRKCTPYFNGDEYLLMYPDVKDADINPLAHYETSGKKENRYADATAKSEKSFIGLFLKKIKKIVVYPQDVYQEYHSLKQELKKLK